MKIAIVGGLFAAARLGRGPGFVARPEVTGAPAPNACAGYVAWRGLILETTISERVLTERLVLITLAAGIAGPGGAYALTLRPALPAVARPDPATLDAALVSRGRTLAAVGDCRGCHTAEGGALYAGGEAERSFAPALDGSAGGPRWSVDALETYLRTGMHPDHSAAAGPIGTVVEGLSGMPRSDVRAMAVYVASLIESAASPVDPHGAALFAAPAPDATTRRRRRGARPCARWADISTSSRSSRCSTSRPSPPAETRSTCAWPRWPIRAPGTS